ncbi:MAG: hypothetical protein KAS17_04510 [Victivallaceae bacterium]|nr:hypothetical protein [Victivallaceae bacterium]
MLNLKTQRKWQFQLGVAMVILPFLYLVYDKSKIFNAIVEGKVVLQESAASQLNISRCIIPIQIIGIILIILTICGVFEKNKNFNKEQDKEII